MDATRETYTRQFILSLAQKLTGTPYLWGGSNPHSGFDCSGFVIWILQVVGVLGPGDWRACDLSRMFAETSTPKCGDLVLYGTGKHASHIVLYAGELEGVKMQVGASGGNSQTTTEEVARVQNAMVKMKPVLYRGDFLGYRDISKRIA